MQPMLFSFSPLSCICIDIHRIIFTLYHSSLLFICIIHLYHSSASHLPRCLSRSVTTSANYLFTCRWRKNRRISMNTLQRNTLKNWAQKISPDSWPCTRAPGPDCPGPNLCWIAKWWKVQNVFNSEVWSGPFSILHIWGFFYSVGSYCDVHFPNWLQNRWNIQFMESQVWISLQFMLCNFSCTGAAIYFRVLFV